MDTSRYVELFLSESREHLGVLARSLLGIEQGGGAEPVEEAFRAAHTLKGMAAAMGYAEVANEAHALEDRLESIRSGQIAVDPALIDELLAVSDRLHAALERSTPEPEPSPRTPAQATDAEREAPPDGPSQGDELSGLLSDEDLPGIDAAVSPAARILIEPSAPLKAARATIICHAVEKLSRIVGCEPAAFDEAFDGNFRLVFPPDADVTSLDRAIREGGEVKAISWETAQRINRQAGPGRKSAPAKGSAIRQVRVDQAHLDSIADSVGELGILRAELANLAASDSPVERVSEEMARLIDDLGHAILGVRMIPVRQVFERFPRVVRDAARGSGKLVRLTLEGTDIQLDRAILEEIGDPLLHLLRNAVDHGIEAPDVRRAVGKPEQGSLTLRAFRERASVLIEVEDDGKGISRAAVVERARGEGLVAPGVEGLNDDELLRVLARPGFTTRALVSELSGRGVGLDVALSRVRALGGAATLWTEEGKGSRFQLRLPISLALAPALRVQAGGEDYVIPLNHVEEVVELGDAVGRQNGREVLQLRGQVVPLVRLGDALSCGGERGAERSAVIAGAGEGRTAIAVDRLIGREQMVVKRFEGPVGTLPYFAGVTLLGDGRPALVLDPTSVF
ncbi:MAG: chemotaxis protein CheA [Gemmatimonadota bacterium]